jgi:hypothetical protein
LNDKPGVLDVKLLQVSLAVGEQWVRDEASQLFANQYRTR